MIKIEIGKLYKVNLDYKDHTIDLGNGKVFKINMQFQLDSSCPPNVYLILDQTEDGYKTLHWEKIEHVTKTFAEENFELIEENHGNIDTK